MLFSNAVIAVAIAASGVSATAEDDPNTRSVPFGDPALSHTLGPGEIAAILAGSMTLSPVTTTAPSSSTTSASHRVLTVSNCRHQADPHGGLPDSCQCDGYSSALPTLSGTAPCAYSTVTAHHSAKTTSQAHAKAVASGKNGTMTTHTKTTTSRNVPLNTASATPSGMITNVGSKMEKVAISMAIVCSLQVVWLLVDSL